MSGKKCNYKKEKAERDYFSYSLKTFFFFTALEGFFPILVVTKCIESEHSTATGKTVKYW